MSARPVSQVSQVSRGLADPFLPGRDVRDIANVAMAKAKLPSCQASGRSCSKEVGCLLGAGTLRDV